MKATQQALPYGAEFAVYTNDGTNITKIEYYMGASAIAKNLICTVDITYDGSLPATQKVTKQSMAPNS